MTQQVCLKCNVLHPVDTGCPNCPPEEVGLDQMVQAASVPNLASLFKRGKDKGLIKAGKEYGE